MNCGNWWSATGPGCRFGQRKREPYLGATVAVVGGAVRGRRGGGDGQTEPGAGSGARGVGAGEPVEGMRQELGWKTGAVVAHPDLHLRAVPGRGEPDGWSAVPVGVVDQIADGAFEVERVGGDGNPRWTVHCGLVSGGEAPE